jgi:hypothetical protein
MQNAEVSNATKVRTQNSAPTGAPGWSCLQLKTIYSALLNRKSTFASTAADEALLAKGMHVLFTLVEHSQAVLQVHSSVPDAQTFG